MIGSIGLSYDPGAVLIASQVGLARASLAQMAIEDPRRSLQIQGGAGRSVAVGPYPTGGNSGKDRALWTSGTPEGGSSPPLAAIAAGVIGAGVLAFVALKMLGKGRRRR